MKKLLSAFSIALLILVSLSSNAQERVLTFGMQFKPMLPVSFLNARTVSKTENNVTYSNNQQFGYNAGGIIRYGISDRFSIESGISFVQRNFNLKVDSLNNSFEANMDYRLIGYEIPVMGLVFIQLDDRVYMTAGMGGVIDLFPSDVFSEADRGDYVHETVRRSWIQGSVMANLGFEFRHKKHGIFYVGGSFHQPFDSFYLSKIGFFDSPLTENTLDIEGTYLTLDFRYYFPEPPMKKKVKE